MLSSEQGISVVHSESALYNTCVGFLDTYLPCSNVIGNFAHLQIGVAVKTQGCCSSLNVLVF